MTSTQQTQLTWDADSVPPSREIRTDHRRAVVRGRSAETAPALAVEVVVQHPDKPAATHGQHPMLLTVRDVEAELQLGRTRTYELLRSGEIPVIRLGRAVRIPRDALRCWIDAHIV
jgi:excisionase family DNA binding protein